MTNDYERFAHDVCCTVLYGNKGGKVDDATVTKVADMLLTGPMFALWPRDVAEANERARVRAAERAARRPEVPRMPVVPPLPRAPVVPPLPRVAVAPQLPRVAPPTLPTLPRPVLK